jgi:hypothetical protein
MPKAQAAGAHYVPTVHPVRPAEEELQQAEATAVRKAVSSRMHTLDEAFLMTLGGFVRAAAEAGDKAIHGVLARSTSLQCDLMSREWGKWLWPSGGIWHMPTVSRPASCCLCWNLCPCALTVQTGWR